MWRFVVRVCEGRVAVASVVLRCSLRFDVFPRGVPSVVFVFRGVSDGARGGILG